MRVTVTSPKNHANVNKIFVAQGYYAHPHRVVAMVTTGDDAFVGESLTVPGGGGASKLWISRFSGPAHTGLPPGEYTLVAYDARDPISTKSDPICVRVRRHTVELLAPQIEYPDNNDEVMRDFCANGTHNTPANVVCKMECSQMSGMHVATTGTPPFAGDLGESWTRIFMMGSRITCTPLTGTGKHNDYTCRAADGSQNSAKSPVTVTELSMPVTAKAITRTPKRKKPSRKPKKRKK